MRNKPIYINSAEEFNALNKREQMVCHITFIRHKLYNGLLPCGPKFIQKEMTKMEMNHIPSISTIARVLRDQYLTHGRTGYYEEDYPKKVGES